MVKRKTCLSFLIFCLLLLILSVGCTSNKTNNDDDLEIISPTKEFIVDKYIQDGMMLQKNSTNHFSGTADPNVKIIVDIKNAKNQIVSTESCVTDKNGNWNLDISAPDNNKQVYMVSIYDSYKKYIKEYTDIVFGNIIVVLGENMFFNSNTTEYNIKKYDNIRICSKDGEWYKSSYSNYINNLTFFIDELVSNSNDTTIGIINVSFKSTQIGAFLKEEILENNSDLKTYNKAVYELLLDDDTHNVTYENSEIYSKYLSNFKNVKCHSLITYQGMTDYISGIDFNKNSQLYAKSLSILLNDLKNNFCYKELLVIESPSIKYNESTIKIDDIALLRSAQSTAAYYNEGIIVPTYELGNDYESEKEINEFTTKLVKILVGKLFSNRNTPSYANLIINDDEIIIEISNCIQLNEVDNINNFKIVKINGDDVTSNYRYYVTDNRIVIYKADESADFSNISILYNFQADIREGNLYNEENEMVNPFIIVLESDK